MSASPKSKLNDQLPQSFDNYFPLSFKKSNYWIGVASWDHVMRGKDLGIAQIGHGKQNGLSKMKQSDLIIYYSPRPTLNSKDPLQVFSAIGQITDNEIYQVDEGNFKPFRRNVLYFKAQQVHIKPLIEELNFIKNKTRWGYSFRFGLLQISSQDFATIAKSMDTKWPNQN